MVKKSDDSVEVEPTQTTDTTFVIETANRTYKLQRPMGVPLGRDHFRLIQKAIIAPRKEGDIILDPTPADIEKANKAVDEWIDVVLPKILIEPTIDEIYPEDFDQIFSACINKIKVADTPFRFI